MERVTRQSTQNGKNTKSSKRGRGSSRGGSRKRGRGAASKTSTLPPHRGDTGPPQLRKVRAKGRCKNIADSKDDDEGESCENDDNELPEQPLNDSVPSLEYTAAYNNASGSDDSADSEQ